MEDNERTFCSLWAERIRVNNCAELFINERFSEDYFFNRLNNVLYCHDDDVRSALEESIRIFSERRLKCYVYIDDSDIRLEKILLENRFTLLDTMQAFRSNVDIIQYENDKIYVDKIDFALLPVWIDVFCKSFNALEWKSEVERILKMNFNKLNLLVSYMRNNSSQIPAGCALLFNLNKLTGLYCLGTVSSFRRRGVARKIIKTSLDICRQQGANFLICQAFTNERFAELYKRLGFKLVYKKKIYALDT